MGRKNYLFIYFLKTQRQRLEESQKDQGDIKEDFKRKALFSVSTPPSPPPKVVGRTELCSIASPSPPNLHPLFLLFFSFLRLKIFIL